MQNRFNITKTVRKFPIDPKLNQIGPQFHGGPLSNPVSHGNENHESLDDLGEGAVIVTAKDFDRFAAEYEPSTARL